MLLAVTWVKPVRKESPPSLDCLHYIKEEVEKRNGFALIRVRNFYFLLGNLTPASSKEGTELICQKHSLAVVKLNKKFPNQIVTIIKIPVLKLSAIRQTIVFYFSSKLSIRALESFFAVR